MRTLDQIRSAGFVGFETVDDLRASKLTNVPTERGVYLVLRESSEPPEFLEYSTAPDPPSKLRLTPARTAGRGLGRTR